MFKQVVCIAGAMAWFGLAQSQVFTKDTLAYGLDSNRINLVYLSDGYTSPELPQFVADSKAFNDHLFQTTPYKEYKAYFNVVAVQVPSPASGIKHANSAADCPSGSVFQPSSDPNNYFGSHFDAFGIHRLVVADSIFKIQAVLAVNFPMFDQVFLIANSPYYGGSGGTWTTATKEKNSVEIATHEMGHSFAGLADEYWAGTQYAAEKPNMTMQSNPELVKWKNWVGISSVGVYPYAVDPSWYRPVRGGQCKMEALNSPFCPVCTEAIVERIHHLVRPIDSYAPVNTEIVTTNAAQSFKLSLVKPNPNTLKVVWRLDGTAVAEGVDSVHLSVAQVGSGPHVVTAVVLDTTALTRSETHVSLHAYLVQWNLNSVTAIVSPALSAAHFQVFPTPFHHELFVNYELSVRSTIRLELFNANGQLLQAFGRRTQNAGKYTLTLVPAGARLTAGTYFIRFWLNGSPLTLKTIYAN